MSIDRIGKGPGAKPPTEGPAAPSDRAADFRVDRSTPAASTGSARATTGASAVTGPSPAEQVRRGELSLDAYLDQRVSEATGHLVGKLGPGDLARVQSTLRSQLAQDPWLRELVTSATGQAPPTGDES